MPTSSEFFDSKCRIDGELPLENDDFVLKNGHSFCNSRYIPTAAVFNGTYQQLLFLEWAIQANISVIYAQDFVGDPAAIPGVKNNTEAFCQFIQTAHRVGIDIHLFGALSLLPRDLRFIEGCVMPPQGPLPPLPPPPTPCQVAITENCGTAQTSTKGFCRRCLLAHLPALVSADCNSTDLKAEAVCGAASTGRSTNGSACDRAFTSMCGVVAEDLGACEECVIGHAAEFIIGWGCGGDVAGFCDQQQPKNPAVRRSQW